MHHLKDCMRDVPIGHLLRPKNNFPRFPFYRVETNPNRLVPIHTNQYQSHTNLHQSTPTCTTNPHHSTPHHTNPQWCTQSKCHSNREEQG